MRRKTVTVRTLRLAGRLALVGVALAGLTACYVDPTLGSDRQGLNELKADMARGFDQQERSAREVKSQVGNVATAVDAQGNNMKAQMEDLINQVRAQSQELEKLRGEVATINGKVDEMQSRLGVDPNVVVNGPPPPTPQARSFVEALNAGRGALEAGRADEALAAFRQAQTLAQNNEQKIESNFWLGETAFRMNNYAEAEQNYWAAIQLDPQHSRAWRSYEELAELDLLKGDKQAAMNKLNTTLDAWGKLNKPEDAARVKARIAEIESGAAATRPGGNVQNFGQ